MTLTEERAGVVEDLLRANPGGLSQVELVLITNLTRKMICKAVGLLAERGRAKPYPHTKDQYLVWHIPGFEKAAKANYLCRRSKAFQVQQERMRAAQVTRDSRKAPDQEPPPRIAGPRVSCVWELGSLA